MLWAIRELKQRPVVYGLSFFIILTAYLAGGFAAFRLDADLREKVTGCFFAGETYWQTVGAVAAKRLVLMGVQAFFCFWMASMPMSMSCGMVVQISLSMPWWCMAGGTAKSVFLAILLFLPSVVYLIAGTYVMRTEMIHLQKMIRERRQSKSAEDKLREGMIPAAGIMLADAVMLACVPLEVFFFMNIA